MYEYMIWMCDKMINVNNVLRIMKTWICDNIIWMCDKMISVNNEIWIYDMNMWWYDKCK